MFKKSLIKQIKTQSRTSDAVILI